MTRTRGRILGVCVLLVGLVCGVIPYCTRTRTGQDPASALRYDRKVELGSVPRGRWASASLPLRNDGPDRMTLTSFRTSCAGTKVYRADPRGRKVEVTDLTLEPGQMVTLGTDINVGGEAGIPQASRISFADAAAPSTTQSILIQYIPMTTLFVMPGRLNFGPFYSGDPLERSLELRSDGSFGEPVVDVRFASDTGLGLSVAYRTPSDPGSAEPLPFLDQTQRALGRLVFRITNTEALPAVDRTVKLVVNEHWEVELPVRADPMARAQFVPRSVVLPRPGRRSVERHAILVCTSREEIQDLVLAGPLPPDLTLTERSRTATQRTIEVAYVGRTEQPTTELERHEIRFDCRTANGTRPVSFTALTPGEAR